MLTLRGPRLFFSNHLQAVGQNDKLGEVTSLLANTINIKKHCLLILNSTLQEAFPCSPAWCPLRVSAGTCPQWCVLAVRSPAARQKCLDIPKISDIFYSKVNAVGSEVPECSVPTEFISESLQLGIYKTRIFWTNYFYVVIFVSIFAYLSCYFQCTLTSFVICK